MVRFYILMYIGGVNMKYIIEYYVMINDKSCYSVYRCYMEAIEAAKILTRQGYKDVWVKQVIL